MQADPGERIGAGGEGSIPSLPILAVVVVVVALGVWVFFGRGEAVPEPESSAPQVETESQPVAAPEPEITPDIPEPEPEVAPAPAPEPTSPPEPVIALQYSDEPLRDALRPVLDSELLASALQAENLVERSAAVIDGLSRGVIRHKLLPLTPPDARFPVITEGSQALMDPTGYRRYDPYVNAIDALDTQALVVIFNRFRPLLEEAYALLGYEAEEFDNALVRGLDRVIDAPVVEGLIEVRKVEAVYKFEDPGLEQLPGVHRQLLRMGPQNTRRIKAKARSLREALLTQ
jgi:hypothetical protein